MGTIFFFLKLTASDMTEILVAMGTIWLVVFVVMLFVANFCLSISPIERFKAKHYEEFTDFSDEVTEAEKTVCEMVDDVIAFIKSRNGPKGLDDPSINTTAIEKAKQAVDGPITTCPESGTVEDRLTRMEQTLQQFIEPNLKQTYEMTVVCESFASVSDSLVDPASRLHAIRQTIHTLKAKYLNPIQQKQADLRQGRVSDCDKKRGAITAVKGP